MADKDLAIRLSLKDGELVRRALTQLGADGQAALRRIEQASAPASKGLLVLSDAVAGVKGEAAGMSSRLGLVGTALTALGPAGLAAGAAVAALSLGLAQGVRAAEEADAAQRKLESVLRATGYASGLTGGEIAAMADQIEKSTAFTAEQVTDAASVLATFRNVAGDSFRRATVAAGDLATVMGGDVSSAAVRLGRMLDEPAEALNTLSRAGITFTDAEQEMISAMVEAGRVGEAQAVILDKIEGKIGGAAAGADGGLTGAVKHLAESWDDLMEQFSRTSGAGTAAAAIIDEITRALKSVTALTREPSIADQMSAKTRELESVRDQITALEQSGGGGLYGLSSLKARAETLGAEIDALVERQRAEVQEEEKARQGEGNATRERNATAMVARLKALDAERVKGVSDSAEKIAAIETQLAKDVAAAQQKTSLSGVSEEDVNREVTLLRTVAQQKIDAVQKPLLEAQARAASQTAKVLADLQREITGVSDPKTAFVEGKVSSLPSGASEQERTDTVALASSLYDLTEKRKADAEAERLRQQAIERTRQFLLQNGDAETVYKLQLEEIEELKRTGALDAPVYAQMVADAEQRKLEAATDAASGIKRALQDYQESAADSASAAEGIVTKSFTAMEDSIVEFAMTGKTSFSSFANSIISDMIRMMVQKNITSNLAAALSTVSLFHEGGEVGAGARSYRSVDPSLFVGAKRLHSGGFGADEVPAVLLNSERVLTAAQQDNTAATISGLAQMARSGGQGGGVTVVSNVYNTASGTEARSEVSQGDDGSLRIDTIIETVEARLSKNITRGQGLAPTLEGRYGLTAAAGAARG